MEKETLTTGSRRDGFSFTGSLGIKNNPNIIRQEKIRIMEKDETFIKSRIKNYFVKIKYRILPIIEKNGNPNQENKAF
jgi:hypothetical protein